MALPETVTVHELASVLGMYYYLRFIATMFMERGESAPAEAEGYASDHCCMSSTNTVLQSSQEIDMYQNSSCFKRSRP